MTKTLLDVIKQCKAGKNAGLSPEQYSKLTSILAYGRRQRTQKMIGEALKQLSAIESENPILSHIVLEKKEPYIDIRYMVNPVYEKRMIVTELLKCQK